MRFLLFFFCIIGLFAQETSMFPQDSDAYTQPMQNQNSPQGFLPATPAPIEKESSLNTPLVQEKDLKNPFEKLPPQEDLIPLEDILALDTCMKIELDSRADVEDTSEFQFMYADEEEC